MKPDKKLYNMNKMWKTRQKELLIQVEAMKRILWAILDMNENGEIIIPEKNLIKAHSVTGDFEFELREDGSAFLRRNIKDDYRTEEEQSKDVDPTAT